MSANPASKKLRVKHPIVSTGRDTDLFGSSTSDSSHDLFGSPELNMTANKVFAVTPVEKPILNLESDFDGTANDISLFTHAHVDPSR
jgi:hypothetical protein